MAKFNRGQVGGVFYKTSPTGFRRYLWLYKIIPYIVGYDIDVVLTIIKGKVDASWNRGVLLTRPPDDRPANKPFSVNYKNGKLVQKCRVYHPSHRGQFTCTMFLEETQQAADGAVVCVSQERAEVVEDLRVESLHTVVAWTIMVILIPALIVLVERLTLP